MKQLILRALSFKKRFFLSVNPSDQKVAVPRLAIIRFRWILFLSAGLNVLLMFSLTSTLERNNFDQEIVHKTAQLAEATHHLSTLYALQIEDLASAYHLYGESLQAPDSDSQKTLLGRYNKKLESYNTRSYELNNVSTVIRDQAQKVADMFKERK
jgi:hypothetical protein